LTFQTRQTEEALHVDDARVVGMNCEDHSWPAFHPDVTRVVHVKGLLRLACLESQPIPPALAELAARWKMLDREVREVRAA